jgi:hypothetical protein
MHQPGRRTILLTLGVSLVIAAGSLIACAGTNEPTNADEGAVTGTDQAALKGSCTGVGGASSGGPGTCGANSYYQCGGDTREIDCSCPQAQCTCLHNGVVTGTVAMNQCPSCTPTKAQLKACGIH